MNTEIKFFYIPVKQKKKKTPRFSSKDFNDKNVYTKKRYKMSINFLELASIPLSTVLHVVNSKLCSLIPKLAVWTGKRHCKIWGPHSSVSGDASLLGPDTASYSRRLKSSCKTHNDYVHIVYT